MALTLKEEAKSIIDGLDDNQTQRVIDYARILERRNRKVDVRNLLKYRGKLDLDIDLDALRGAERWELGVRKCTRRQELSGETWCLRTKSRSALFPTKACPCFPIRSYGRIWKPTRDLRNDFF